MSPSCTIDVISFARFARIVSYCDEYHKSLWHLSLYFAPDHGFVSFSHPEKNPMNEGRVVSRAGLVIEEVEPIHLESLAKIAKVVEFGANEVIFREGEAGDTVFLIEDGRIAVEIFVPGRGRTTVLTLGPGQLLGWSPLFKAKPNTATGRTLAPTRALALDASKLRNLCDRDHVLGCVIGWRLAEVIAGRLRSTRLQLLDIFAHEK